MHNFKRKWTLFEAPARKAAVTTGVVMDAATINRLVRGLGRTYTELVANGEIPNQPMAKLYDESDWLTLAQESGLELNFWAETKRLEKILISLIPTEKGDPVYMGELPAPFSLNMDQAGVLALLGKPMESKGAVTLPGGLGMRGGWDAYRLQAKTHSNARVGFSYTADMKVKTLAFALLNPGHE